jgi:hypothetical protein
MRTTPALRITAAALLTGGTLAVAATGTTAVAGDKGETPGTVVSRTDLNVREAPTVNSAVVDRLAPGSHVRIDCQVRGEHVNGNAFWYWLDGIRGWASAAFVDTGGQQVPNCADPVPEWKDGSWSNRDPSWNDAEWSVTVSGSWNWSVTAR